MKPLYAFLIVCGLSASLLQAQIPLSIQQRMQDTISHLRLTKKYKGISAAVSWRAKGDWKGTVGISHAGQPLTDSMVIGIGSNTKTFLAAAICRLVEMNMLSLTDSIGKWLPPMPHIKGSITLSQLLHHTTGLYNYTQNSLLGDSINANPFRVWTKAELVSKFVKAPYFLPGQGWNYSNTNYLLAGMIAELAAGKDVAQLINEAVLVPAGLGNTFFPPYETVTSPRARVWSNLGYGYLQSQVLPVQFYSVADAAGGMISSAEDNCKFWVSLMNGTIIQKATLRNEMMNWEPVTSSMAYGLAMMKEKVQGNETYSHGGNILGQTCANLADTVRGITISVLTNQDSLQNEVIVHALYKIIVNGQKIITGLPSVTGAEFDLYPNPASTSLRVTSPFSLEKVTVLDVTGRIVFTAACNSNHTEIELSTLPAGVYLLEMRWADGATVNRFIKE